MRWCLLLAGVLLCLALSTPVWAGIGQGMRVEASELWEKSCDATKNHASYVFGFTWRLGG